MSLALAFPILAEPLHFSLAEMSLLAALCLASAGLFAARLAPITRNILRSRPEPGFRLAPLGRRTWVFVSEVLCQSKVIRQRPLPGLAHAFVFWGFLAFALVTLNHLLTGLRLGVLQHTGFIGTFYFGFAGLWAILVAISIAGLFIRRFLIRPRWLGEKVSVESGVIAALIFVLMTTYLAAYTVPGDGVAVKTLWWAHTLALLAFLPLIPHTKHLHLVLSPLTVFLKREQFSAIPPLTSESGPSTAVIPRGAEWIGEPPVSALAHASEADTSEDIGLLAGRDLTQIISLQAYSCVECGRCTEHCPAATTGKLLNPKEITLGVRDYLNNFGPLSAEPLLTDLRNSSPEQGKQPGAPSAPTHLGRGWATADAHAIPTTPAYLSSEAAFQCTTCGACEYQCPVGVQHLPILVGLRRGAVNTGAWEDKHGTRLFLALEKQGNALGLPTSQRDRFIADTKLPIFDGTQEYCLWLGCMGSYDPKGREIIADFARIMRHLGASFGVLRKEKCTGDPARRLGNDLVFDSLAEQGSTALRKSGVRRLVSICPHCVRTIATDWATSGFAAEGVDAEGRPIPIAIEHHSEFLARHAYLLPAAHHESLSSSPETGPQPLSSRPEAAGRSGEIAVFPEVSGEATSKSTPEPRAALNPAPTVAFHDPCYLGRYRDTYDAPREVIQHAAQLIEAPRHRERSFCCGAGGGLAFLGEEAGQRVSHVRAQELIATGASTIGTACPFCNTMFKDALSAVAGPNPPQLLDIAQLTARSLPPEI